MNTVSRDAAAVPTAAGDRLIDGAARSAESACAAHVRQGSAAPLRVLVADDDRDCADSTLLLLDLWGHDCRAVYCGREALDAVESFRPDVFLLDIGMPQMNGFELARCLRERFREALLVAVTGHANDRALGREAGFDLYLAKPVNPPELEALLRHECEKRAALSISSARAKSSR